MVVCFTGGSKRWWRCLGWDVPLPARLLVTGVVRRHIFSHFHLDILPLEVRLEGMASAVMDGGRLAWYNIGNPDTRGLPAPVARMIAEWKERGGEEG